ncbi:MAG: hypothetical protein LCH91_28705 [Bacteroidetes bacterium]|nr:hypothetical protein [Bacteroidota bacterium]
MKYLLTFLFSCAFLFSFSQSFPTNQQVIADVKKYHGKLSTAQLNGDWQLVKESGYTFANTAKHPVAAVTTKDANGTQTKIQGLAIYVRGSARDGWRFSRYFVYENSREVVGAKMPSNEEMVSIVEKALAEKSNLVFNNCSWICWIYAIRVPEKVNYQQQSASEMSFEVEIEYEERLSGMTERSKQIVEFFCRKINNQWQMNYSMRRQTTPVSKQTVSQDVLETTPGICDKPFAELYGPQGPSFTSSKSNSKVGGRLKNLLKVN